MVSADYNLPNGLNGLQVVASLREMLGHEIPAIILTGDISTDTLREIAGKGCIQLNKPVKAAALTRLIQQLLAATRRPTRHRPTRPPARDLRGRRRQRLREAMRELLEAEAGRSRSMPAARRSSKPIARPQGMPAGRCPHARHGRARAAAAAQGANDTSCRRS